MTQLAKLDAAIAEARERLERLLTARAVLVELDGGDPAPAPCGCHDDRVQASGLVRKEPTDPAEALDRRRAFGQAVKRVAGERNRMTVAAVLLERGPLPYADLQRACDLGHTLMTKTLMGNTDWFVKVGEPKPNGISDRRPWGLTAEARAALGAPPVVEPPAPVPPPPPPPGEIRHNPDLDDAFDPKPPVPATEAVVGKVTPRPEPAAEPGPLTTRTRILGLLATGPKPYSDLIATCGVTQNVFLKTLRRMRNAGQIVKQDGPRLGPTSRGRWAITPTGRRSLVSAGATSA